MAGEMGLVLEEGLSCRHAQDGLGKGPEPGRRPTWDCTGATESGDTRKGLRNKEARPCPGLSLLPLVPFHLVILEKDTQSPQGASLSPAPVTGRREG